MNDKELADKVVALGVLRKVIGDNDVFYNREILEPLETADTIVRDWRVAGALLCRPEIWSAIMDIENASHQGQGYLVRIMVRGGQMSGKMSNGVKNQSLPRAIIEACVEALEASK